MILVAHGRMKTAVIASIGMSKIKSWKGGRSERIEARISPEAKAALLARVNREGYGSFADWLEAQAMPHLTKRALDVCPVCDGKKYFGNQWMPRPCEACGGTGKRK